jgi:hypothetical protein
MDTDFHESKVSILMQILIIFFPLFLHIIKSMIYKFILNQSIKKDIEDTEDRVRFLLFFRNTDFLTH